MSAKKLAQIRDQITALVDQRAEIADAAITRQEAAARFDHLIARIQDDAIKGMGPSSLRNGGDERTVGEWLGRPGFLCEVFPDQIKAALLARFDAEVGDAPEGLPSVERAKRLAALAGEIYELEQAEESIIEALEADGIDVQRRPDASPHAQLGLPPGRAAA